MFRPTLMIALVVVICSVPLAAQATRPAGPGEQGLRYVLLGDQLDQQWVLDRSLSTSLAGPADNPASRLSGQFIMHLNSADASAGPSTRPADVQGYVTLDLRPMIVGNLDKQIRLSLAATQPSELVIEDIDSRTRDLLRAREFITLKLADAGEQNTAYMGIGVEAPGPALRSQLSLPEGAGLVVNYLDDNGPSKNIIHMHDVLQKLDDQILVNGEQLVTLVRMHKPGDAITLTLLRQASPRTERITLGQRQPETKDPQSNADSQQLTELTALPYIGRLYQTDSDAHPITFNDGDVLASLNGHGDLLVIDQKTGKTLFNGPIGSKEQWEQAPEAVRNKLNAWRAMIAVYQPADKR
jgi:hypothetical protein